VSTKKKILFITQDLGRTGSEIVLGHLLQHLDPEKYEMYVFCIKKGALYETLPAYIGKSILYQNSPDKWDRIFRRVLKKFKINTLNYQLKKIQKEFRADIWFINTIVSPDVYELAKRHGVKIATYIHELLYAFTFITLGSMQKIISYSDVCIGCSEEVCKRIVELGHKNVKLQHSFIDTDLIQPDFNRVMTLREEFGFLLTDFVWVVSGKTTYMKGLDYMVSILEFFKEQPVKILWVGGEEDTGLTFYVQQVAKHKYPGKLFFTGAQSADYYNYLSVANGLLLPSREESFSLVLIEAAKLGLPVVSFDLGIANKFITQDMGRVVKGRNIEDFIAQMQFVHENPNFDTAKMVQASLEYSVQRQIPNFEKLIAELF
jgi:glycosyltransferase involved in cell wall biosynthesis